MLNSDFHCNRENWRSLNDILFEWKIFQNMIEREDWRKEAQIRNWYSEEAIANVGLQSWNNIFWCPTYYALSKTNSDQIKWTNRKQTWWETISRWHINTSTTQQPQTMLVCKIMAEIGEGQLQDLWHTGAVITGFKLYMYIQAGVSFLSSNG